MKKALSILLCLAMIMALLAGCGAEKAPLQKAPIPTRSH